MSVPPSVSNRVPAPDDIDVSIATSIKFTISSNPTDGVNLSTINVDIDKGGGFTAAVLNGVLQAGYNGAGSIVALIGDDSGYNITIVPTTPLPKSQVVNVRVNAENSVGDPMPQVDYGFTTAAVAFVYSFTTKSRRFIFPVEYSEEVDLTSLPSGFTPQTLGTGSPPIYNSFGMTTIPNASGASFIRKASAGITFENGVLVDMIVSVPPGSTFINKRIKVLKLSVADQGAVSVSVNFTTKEVWIDDITNSPISGFRPGIKTDKVFFRLSIKGCLECLVARLYSGKANTIEPYLLKQTGGPSETIPTIINYIEIGSIKEGDADILVESVKILNGEDPDAYYPFPEIKNVTPKSDIISGNRTFNVTFKNDIDIDAGSESLFVDDVVADESTGMSSVIVDSGIIKLSTNGIGSSIAKMLRSYSGDLPSGANISFDVDVPISLITNPLQTEVLLFGAQFGCNGTTLYMEMLTSIINGTYFRVKLANNGTQTLNKKLTNIQKSNFTFRIVRAGRQIKMLVDEVTLISTSIKDGPGILRLYNETSVNTTILTQITNFTVRPILMIGDSIVNA